MENLNAEQVKNKLEQLALEPCMTGVTIKGHSVVHLLRDALALINSQEQRIGKLECKVEEHRADAISWQATVEEITKGEKTLFDVIDALRRKSRECDELNLKAFELERKIKELTEEVAEEKAKDKMCAEVIKRQDKEIAKKDAEIKRLRADTVREMQQRLDKRFCHDPAFLGVEQRLIMGVIDEIAKEMLEGEK